MKDFFTWCKKTRKSRTNYHMAHVTRSMNRVILDIGIIYWRTKNPRTNTEKVNDLHFEFFTPETFGSRLIGDFFGLR